MVSMIVAMVCDGCIRREGGQVVSAASVRVCEGACNYARTSKEASTAKEAGRPTAASTEACCPPDPCWPITRQQALQSLPEAVVRGGCMAGPRGGRRKAGLPSLLSGKG